MRFSPLWSSRFRWPVWSVVALLAGLFVVGAACTSRDADPAPAKQPAPLAATPASSSPARALPLGEQADETWDVLYVQDARAGYIHTTTRTAEHQGRRLVEIVAVQQLATNRFGDRAEPAMQLKSVETPDGQLVEFETELRLGPAPLVSTGKVEGSHVIINNSSTGKTVTERIDWPAQAGGFFAVEQSLRQRPLRPGESRSVTALLPMFNRPAMHELRAREVESTELLDGSQKLLRVDVSVELPGAGPLQSVLWADDQGRVVKAQVPAMRQTIYRTTKAAALQTEGKKELDLGHEAIIRLKAPVEGAHRAKRARYAVRIAREEALLGKSLAEIFPAGLTQEVRASGPDRAEIVVHSVRPAPSAELPPAPADDRPQAADREPNNLVQSDHPRIIEMAQEAAGDEREPWRVALALERYVHQTVREVNFSQTLATAADVAQNRSGDCTERAVLLAALARARDIPARVAIGLVYVDKLQGFGYHMWNELYVDGRWVPLDATLGQGGIGAGHLKLATSSLAGADAFAAPLPVAELMGRLEIEALDVQP